ncbi:hypothetical protein CANCADRAFT_812 [Tortispora caseinolytica NRRL Y-17796]|uniref:Tetratricopeptide repeat protein 36 n=1 Tax=Tortispora caseinolytica NRRL Y-17796 TaxID=767744 RepID=A0A1E4TKE9_9ASCO|nr:hypothetical protein CANCADRAFT_812 [Tortispora caseinolytica NRRL Y-17796]
MSIDFSKLSERDISVIDQVFDPEGGGGIKSVVVPDIDVSFVNEGVDIAEAREAEETAVKAAEAGDIHRALIEINELLRKYPNYASAYNNRAQIRRMKGEIDEAIIDLYECLKHARPEVLSGAPDTQYIPSGSVPVRIPSNQVLILSQAHAQLGSIYMSKASNLSDDEGWSLKAQASKHFAASGVYGNELSRKLATAINPYARLCGSIVKQALEQEMCGGQ